MIETLTYRGGEYPVRFLESLGFGAQEPAEIRHALIDFSGSVFRLLRPKWRPLCTK